MDQPIRLNPETVRQGLGWAQSWTSGPVLCVATADALRFVVVNERRFIASWEWAEETDATYSFFLIPPFVANTLAAHTAYGITGLRVRTNRNHIALSVRDDQGEYVIQWRWQAAAFEAPPFFDQMSQPPQTTLEEKTYMAIADAVHLAIANLGRLEAMEQINRQNLAIVVDFAPGHFNIDGQPIVGHDAQRFYFDPRLIMRGLEVARGRQIGFALTPTDVPGQSILHMISQRENWRIHCALLSILPEEAPTLVGQQVRQVAQSGRLIMRTPPEG